MYQSRTSDQKWLRKVSGRGLRFNLGGARSEEKKSKVHLRNFSCSLARPGQSGRSEPSFALRTGKPSLLRFKMFPPLLLRAHATASIGQAYKRAWPAQSPALRVGLQGTSEGFRQARGGREGAGESSVFLFPKARICPGAAPCLQGFPFKEPAPFLPFLGRSSVPLWPAGTRSWIASPSPP